jgi:hypothetical protein
MLQKRLAVSSRPWVFFLALIRLPSALFVAQLTFLFV